MALRELLELDVVRAAEPEALRAVELAGAALRLLELLAGVLAVEPLLVVEVEPEGVVVRVVVSDEPDSLTRLLTVVWVVAALELEPVEVDLDALLPVVVVLRVAGVVAVLALRELLLDVAVLRELLPEVAVERLVLPEVAAERLVLPVVAAEREELLEPAAVRAVLLEVAALRAVPLLRELLLVTEVASYCSRMSRALATRLVPLVATFALRTENERSGCCLP